MREDLEAPANTDATIIDLGAATDLTQGTFMPLARESIIIADYFDQP